MLRLDLRLLPVEEIVSGVALPRSLINGVNVEVNTRQFIEGEGLHQFAFAADGTATGIYDSNFCRRFFSNIGKSGIPAADNVATK